MSLAGALVAVVLCLLLAPAMSKADTTSSSQCPDVSLSNPFGIFGDLANYTPVADGHFENGTGDWSLYGSTSVVPVNEPYFIRSSSDSNSLQIGSGAKAVSSAFCVDTGYPYFRFFARNPSGGFGTLKVKARWTVGDYQQEETLGYLWGASYRSWSVSDLLPLCDRIDLQNGTQNVRLVFQSLSGTWQIDDVLIDPYRR
jgi:hypothetical protein